ncbi:MAG: hypothetical protein POELPBGB_01352 [Bacteroidia bacterium]|nr:hypothetical protein [Bacteroidia bacterium]
MKIIEKLLSLPNKGKYFEKLVYELLKDLGFANVRLQNAGSQFGYDISARKYSHELGQYEVWKFECKNLNRKLNVTDIASKLVWHDAKDIDRFVIVSPTDLSNELHHILENTEVPFAIELWIGESLESKFIQSKTALQKLGLEDYIISTPVEPHIYTPQAVRFDFFDPEKPNAYDYFIHNTLLIKSHTESLYQVWLQITNKSNEKLDVLTLKVITTQYIQNTQNRIIRQHTLRGIYEPTRLYFHPSEIIGKSIAVLPDAKIYSVLPKTSETLLLELSNIVVPGYYKFYFEGSAIWNKRRISFKSEIFSVNVIDHSQNRNFLFLYSQKHYDSPMAALLKTENNIWEKLQDIYNGKNSELRLQPLKHKNDSNIQKWQVTAKSDNKSLTVPLETQSHEELWETEFENFLKSLSKKAGFNIE